MIRFLDSITPFINEVFKVRKKNTRKKPTVIYAQVFGYSIIMLSLLSNYFLIKKVYTISVANYRYSQKVENYDRLVDENQICLARNRLLIDLIDGTLDKNRPIKRNPDLDMKKSPLPEIVQADEAKEQTEEMTGPPVTTASEPLLDYHHPSIIYYP